MTSGVYNGFKTKFETVEHEPVFEEAIHGASAKGYKNDMSEEPQSMNGSVDDLEAKSGHSGSFSGESGSGSFIEEDK